MRLLSVSRLSTRLVLMALIAVVPALAITAYTQRIERDDTRARTLEDNLQVTRLAANREAAVFDGAQRALQTLALFPVIRSSDSRTCEALLREILRDYPGYIAFGVINPDGSTFCSSSGLSVQNQDRVWFQRAVQTRTTAVGGYQISPLTGTPDILIGRPLFGSSGAVERVIFVAIEVDHLKRLVSELKLPRGVVLTLFDRDRTILARYPDSEQRVGKVLPETLIGQHIGARQL